MRKLDVSVGDIKDILDGKVELKTVISHNIEALQDKISELDASLKICEEINEKQIDLNSFDEKY